MLYGLHKQGVKCTSCNITAHKKCTKLIGDMCGYDHTEKRGRIKINIKYEACEESIYLFIEEGRNLVPMDPTGYSDPYIKVKLIPDFKEVEKVKTQIKKSTLNPVWNETLIVKGISKKDKGSRLLDFWL